MSLPSRRSRITPRQALLITALVVLTNPECFASTVHSAFKIEMKIAVMMFIGLVVVETAIVHHFLTLGFGAIIGPIILGNLVSMMPWFVMGIEELGIGHGFWAMANDHIFPLLLRFMPRTYVLMTFILGTLLIGVIFELIVLRLFWREESRRDFALAVLCANGATTLAFAIVLWVRPEWILVSTVV